MADLTRADTLPEGRTGRRLSLQAWLGIAAGVVALLAGVAAAGGLLWQPRDEARRAGDAHLESVHRPEAAAARSDHDAIGELRTQAARVEVRLDVLTVQQAEAREDLRELLRRVPARRSRP